MIVVTKKELATLTGRGPELCGWALCPSSCGWALCPPAFRPLLLSVQVLPSSLATPLNSVARLWLGSVAGPCPPLVLAAPLNSVAGLGGPVYWRGVRPNK